MKFGIHGPAHVTRSVQTAVRAEQLGYDAVSFGDSQMIWSDVYATMALAAQATSRISIGSGVSVVGTRQAPVVAAAAATVNQIAPGRVFLGLGTGATSYACMGHRSPVKRADWAAYAKTVKGLLAGGEVDYAFNGQVKPIQFLTPGLGYLNTEEPIPVYLAAMGPQGQELAGEIADGIFDNWGSPADLEQLKQRLRTGAERAGRSLDGFAIWCPNSNFVVLDPGEELTSDRVIEHAGPFAAMMLHGMYAAIGRVPSEQAPPFIAPFWDEYCSMMESWPERTHHYRAHAGHVMYILPEERQYITPELIRAFSIVGQPEEIVETLREWEKAGVTHVNLIGTPDTIDEKMERFARLVIAKF